MDTMVSMTSNAKLDNGLKLLPISSHFPKSLWSNFGLQEAPFFLPTLDEFQDPVKYIESIYDIVEEAGICRIIPPPGWDKQSFLRHMDLGKFCFPTRRQRLESMQIRAKDDPYILLAKDIGAFWKQRKTKLARKKTQRSLSSSIFLINGQCLDLPYLYQIVKELEAQDDQSIDELETRNRWNNIAKRMKITNKYNMPWDYLVDHIFECYQTYLLPYHEEKSKMDQKTAMNKMEVCSNSIAFSNGESSLSDNHSFDPGQSRKDQLDVDCAKSKVTVEEKGKGQSSKVNDSSLINGVGCHKTITSNECNHGLQASLGSNPGIKKSNHERKPIWSVINNYSSNSSLLRSNFSLKPLTSHQDGQKMDCPICQKGSKSSPNNWLICTSKSCRTRVHKSCVLKGKKELINLALVSPNGSWLMDHQFRNWHCQDCHLKTSDHDVINSDDSVNGGENQSNEISSDYDMEMEKEGDEVDEDDHDEGEKYHIADYESMANRFFDVCLEDLKKRTNSNPFKSCDTIDNQLKDQSSSTSHPFNLRDLEAYYWKIVEERYPTMHLDYGSSLDVRDYPSGFPLDTTNYHCPELSRWLAQNARPSARKSRKRSFIPTTSVPSYSFWDRLKIQSTCTDSVNCHLDNPKQTTVDKKVVELWRNDQVQDRINGAEYKEGKYPLEHDQVHAISCHHDLHQGVLNKKSTRKALGSSLEADDFMRHSGWNLNNLSYRTLLKYLNESIAGVTRPMIYVGMLFSSFCWHTEDNWLQSINYIHSGAPKIWYAVPAKHASQFEQAFKQQLPGNFEDDPQLLHRLTTMLSPQRLSSSSLNIFTTLHQEGEFVITSPRSFHSGFNLGFNIAESVNFATWHWLDFGLKATNAYRFERSAVFSHEKLIYNIIQDANHMRHTKSLEIAIVQFLKMCTDIKTFVGKRLKENAMNTKIKLVIWDHKVDQILICSSCDNDWHCSELNHIVDSCSGQEPLDHILQGDGKCKRTQYANSELVHKSKKAKELNQSQDELIHYSPSLSDHGLISKESARQHAFTMPNSSGNDKKKPSINHRRVRIQKKNKPLIAAALYHLISFKLIYKFYLSNECLQCEICGYDCFLFASYCPCIKGVVCMKHICQGHCQGSCSGINIFLLRLSLQEMNQCIKELITYL